MSSSRHRGPLSHILDTSASTNSEKAENIAKTSLVMLGAIGAATLAAHKFWPKGVTYGDKEDWECEEKGKRDKVKDKAKDVKAAITGEPRRDERGRGGSGSGSGSGNGNGNGSGSGSRDDDDRRGGGRGGGRGEGREGRNGDNDRDRSRERRTRYLEDRERRGGPPSGKDRPDPRRLALPAAAAAGAAYQEDRRRTRRARDDEPPPPPPPASGPRDRYGDYDYDPREWRDRYAEGPGPGPTPPATQRRVERIEQYTSAPPPPPPPPPEAPNPPSVVSYNRADAAPMPVVISSAPRAPRGCLDAGRGRYYVDRDTIVIPSRGETEFVVNRAAPPGNRLTVERDGRFYR